MNIYHWSDADVCIQNENMFSQRLKNVTNYFVLYTIHGRHKIASEENFLATSSSRCNKLLNWLYVSN